MKINLNYKMIGFVIIIMLNLSLLSPGYFLHGANTTIKDEMISFPGYTLFSP